MTRFRIRALCPNSGKQVTISRPLTLANAHWLIIRRGEEWARKGFDQIRPQTLEGKEWVDVSF